MYEGTWRNKRGVSIRTTTLFSNALSTTLKHAVYMHYLLIGVMNEVPMVCCPTGADQFANAARVKSAGAGVLAKSNATTLGWIFGSDPTSGLNVVEPTVNVLDSLEDFQACTGEVHRSLSRLGGSKIAVDLIEGVGRVGYPNDGKNRGTTGQKRRSWSNLARRGGALCGCTLAGLSYYYFARR